VIFIIFILAVGWRYRRRRLPRQAPFPGPQYAPNINNNNKFDKSELAGTSTLTANPLRTNPSESKPSPGMSVVSPVSPMDGKDSHSLAGKLEMEAKSVVLPWRTEMDAHNRSGVQAQPYAQELHPEQARYEVQGSNQHPVEVPALGANMNAGPYYELEGPYR
jgi:hypothetical protein